MRKVSLLLTALFMLVTTAGAATYTVTTTADTGVGSLRQAIIDANASGTAGIVQFAIPAGGAQVITLNSALPPITVKLDINGYTQPGSIKPGATWPAKIMVQLQGNGNYNGLEFTTAATGSSVTGMSIVGFGTDVDHAGIYTSAPNVTIAGNLIGLKNDGTKLANSIGVLGAGADNVVVGGTTPDCRNVISGNTYEGITFIPIGANLDNFASGELVQYNYVGTNVYGTAAIGNGTHGVDFDGANNSSILDNVIGGSGQYGIGCDATYSTTPTIPKIHDVTIMRNRIGIGVNGEDIGNGKAGIMVINAYNIIIGSSVANANIICYNENGVVVLDYPAGTASHTYDVAITYNRIYNNDYLGIDLSTNAAQLLPDGVTVNDVGDADTGPNELQNFPVITEAYVKDGILTIKGTIDTDQANANIIIVFFRNPKGIITPEPSGYGENYVRIGLIQVTTNASGDATFTANYPASTVAGEGQANYGDNIVAFSRGHNNQTSEYSKYYVVTAVPDEVCASTTTPVSYTVPAVEGATSYTWTVPSGAIISSGQGTNTISVNWSAVAIGSYEIKVIATNTCGNSNETVMPVVIKSCSTDLVLTKTDSPDPVLAGQQLSYTIVVTNSGAIPALNVAVNDVLPAGLLNISATPTTGTWTAPAWTIGTLAAGASATLTITATVDPALAGTSLANTATVTSDTPDSNTANNTATATTTVNKQADVTLGKTCTTTPVVAGLPVQYTLTVSNAGPSVAQNVQVADVNTSLSNMQYSFDGTTWIAWTGSYTLGVLGANITVPIYIKGTVLSSVTGSLGNTATVISSTPDNNTGNNTSTVTSTVTTSADLAIQKSFVTAPITAGNTVVYKLLITNEGPSFAATVTFTDNLTTPDPYNNNSIQYSLDNGSTWLTWTGSYTRTAGLAAGETTFILVRGILKNNFSGNTVSNTASVSSTTNDPVSGNNTSTVTSLVNVSADLSISKSGTPNPVIAGQTISYTLAVNNAGPSSATVVRITDNFDPLIFSNIQYQFESTSGNWPASGILNIGDIAASSGKTVTITATVNPGVSQSSITNFASVNSSTPDPVTGNNTSSAQTNVTPRVDLGLVMTAPASVDGGSSIQYSLTATNYGPSNAVNVSLTDNIPASITSHQFSLDNGATWQAWTGSYADGTLTVGGSLTVLIRGVVNVNTCSSISNSATVSSGTTEVSPDNTHLNTASATTTVTDVTPPTITSCLNPVALSCTADIPAKDAASIVATDNCTASGSLTKAWVSDVKSNETCTNRYTLTRTYSVTDASSNIATCTQIITVNDQTPPSISCPGPVEVSCASLIPAAATDYATFVGQGGTASDNCTGAVTITHVIDEVTNQSCTNRYTLTRTYRATDLCGNSTDCKQVITINDQTAPTFTPPANVNISCDASTDPDFTGRPVITSDNCGATNNTATYTDVITQGSCANNYTIARTWIVSDQCGNHTEHIQTITVSDTSSPVITCPGSQTRDNEAGKCSYTAIGTEFDPVSATDNCGVKSVTYSLTGETTGAGSNSLAGVIFNKGVTTVKWTITDNCDHSAECSFTVTVNDTEKPSITPPADIIHVPDSYRNYATVTNIGTPVTSDNCSVASVVSDAPANNQYPIGNTTVIWTVTDGSGNITTTTQTITVTPPTVYYWTGGTSTDWNTASNWVANLIPFYNSNVEFATASNYGTPAARDLVVPATSAMTIHNLTNASTKNLIVPAGATLNVTGVVTGSSTLADASKIQVKATSSSSPTTPNGTFIINCDAQSTSGSPDVYVTVDLYAKGFIETPAAEWTDNIAGSPTNGTKFTASYHWQHFGVPVETVKANPTFYGSFLREYHEEMNSTVDPTKSSTFYAKWINLTNSSDLTAFKGYEITQDQATTYSIAGKLQYCDRDLELTRSAPLVANANTGNINNNQYGLGQNIFGNSYTASIDIYNLTFPDRVEPTVYLYNTGRFTDWATYGALNIGEPLSAGQYTSIPQNAAPVIYDGKIPSLNGFLLIHRGYSPYYESATDDPVTMKLPYANSLVTNTRPQTVARKPLSYMLVNLASKSTRDNLWLFSQPGTTNKLDDGWDGRKFFGTPTAFIYTENADGPMQVSADKTIDGTVLNFYANSDTEYTLTLSKTKLDEYKDLHLIDLRTRTSTPLVEDVTTYRFTADNKGNVEKRFVIANSANIDLSSEKFKFLDAYVLNNNRLIITNFTPKDGTMYLYDAIGKTLMNRNITPYINDIPVALQTGVYILNLQADGKNQNIKLIIK